MKIISDAFPPTKPLHSLPPSRSTLIMANHCTSLCLIGFMDHLWFHQIVLFPEPTSPSSSNYKSPVTLGEEEEEDDDDEDEEEEDTDSMLLVTSSEIDPPPSSSPLSVLTNLEGMDSNEEDGEKMIMGYKNNPSKLPSSSLSSKNGLNYVRVKSKKKKRGGSVLRSKSCGSRSWELELEEVKGFMDLGFKFEKEQLNPELLSVVPGLQRFSSISTDSDEQRDQGIGVDLAPVEDDDDGVGIMRPYLSEAWLIRRPDSPLLNLKMPPRVSDAADMKKHLRCWARTVASVVLQD